MTEATPGHTDEEMAAYCPEMICIGDLKVSICRAAKGGDVYAGDVGNHVRLQRLEASGILLVTDSGAFGSRSKAYFPT